LDLRAAEEEGVDGISRFAEFGWLVGALLPHVGDELKEGDAIAFARLSVAK